MKNPKCVRKLESLLGRGYVIVGKYGRNGNWLYLKRGNEVIPFCLNDPTVNHELEPARKRI